MRPSVTRCPDCGGGELMPVEGYAEAVECVECGEQWVPGEYPQDVYDHVTRYL